MISDDFDGDQRIEHLPRPSDSELRLSDESLTKLAAIFATRGSAFEVLRVLNPTGQEVEALAILLADFGMHDHDTAAFLALGRARANRAKERIEFADLEEGHVVDGIVTYITDYGAYVDLGDVEALLPIADMAWGRVNHPSDIVSIGQQVKVRITRLNPQTQRISVGMKQFEPDPWENIGAKYPVGRKVSGTVTDVTEYGAFVELEPGIEGLMPVSEMSSAQNARPREIVSANEVVDVVVLDVDLSNRRMSLGLRQLGAGDASAPDELRKNAVVAAEVIEINDRGIKVKLVNHEDITSFIRRTDLSLDRDEQRPERFSVGEIVNALVIFFSNSDRRVLLSIKALEVAAIKEALARSDAGASLGDILGATMKTRGRGQ